MSKSHFSYPLNFLHHKMSKKPLSDPKTHLAPHWPPNCQKVIASYIMAPFLSFINIYKWRPPGYPLSPVRTQKHFVNPKIDQRKASSVDGEGGLHHEGWSESSLFSQVWLSMRLRDTISNTLPNIN